MENTLVKEGTDILKKLSPKNQTYFMTLLRLAEIAEDGARNELLGQPCKLPAGQQESKTAEPAVRIKR